MKAVTFSVVQLWLIDVKALEMAYFFDLRLV
jgi:hypothetical protein